MCVQTQKVDAIVPMGVLIKGDTDHYDMIKDAATSGILVYVYSRVHTMI